MSRLLTSYFNWFYFSLDVTFKTYVNNRIVEVSTKKRKNTHLSQNPARNVELHNATIATLYTPPSEFLKNFIPSDELTMTHSLTQRPFNSLLPMQRINATF
jgi:hypothetical protein